MEARDAVSNFEGRVAIDTGCFHPGRLARNVVRHLVLEEDVGASVAAPDDVELLVVLDEEAIGGRIVAVDDDAGVGGIAGPADAVSMVGAP